MRAITLNNLCGNILVTRKTIVKNLHLLLCKESVNDDYKGVVNELEIILGL